MACTDEEEQTRAGQGNAVENETREAESFDEESAGFDDEGRLVKRPEDEPEDEPKVSEEESKLAEEFPDGESPGRKY